MRISRTRLNMDIALLISQRGTCNRGAVGCVIARDGRIISTGYNGAPVGLPHCHDVGCDCGDDGGCKRTIHAEAGAITFAAKNGLPLNGAIMYVTSSPCIDCAKLIINCGIKMVFYYNTYRDVSGLELLEKAGIETKRLP